MLPKFCEEFFNFFSSQIAKLLLYFKTNSQILYRYHLVLYMAIIKVQGILKKKVDEEGEAQQGM